ncbi:MAG: CBS domain-containing protein [Caldilineaceae bacterium]|nr:CBS domain-containing protein [Caldilineaceae bacterium]
MPPNTVILAHEHADFDALASLLGASLVFPGATPVLPRSINRNGRAFLALYRNQFPFVEAKEMTRQDVDLAILVDTRSFNSVKGMGKETRFLVIDHHSVDEPMPEGWQCWEEALGPMNVGANTTLLVEKLMQQHYDLRPLQATLLALGIYEDTGSLLYKSTTHRDLRAAGWLLEQGANLEVLNRFMHYPLSDAQLALSQQLIDNAEHMEIAGQSIVLATATAHEFKDELSALAHKLRELYDPDGIFLVVDLGDRIQVVARSTTDAVDVGKVADALGGGGHNRAAAAMLRDGKLENVRARVLSLARRHTRPPVTVRQIMSRGRPQLLPPNLPVEEAARLMRRYGHEGFPVVEEGDDHERLVGILTRRDADRAIDHKLGDRPVHKIMRAGDVTIGPDAPIDELHRRMIESGWGQIPVVDEDGKIIGIVTRTDLIKLWADEGPISDQVADVKRQLVDALTPTQHLLLRMAGETAAGMGFSVYVVGGFARDLLLDRVGESNGGADMDIVVEGDAIELIVQMQLRCGGRVVTHQRFGTAKWILDDPDRPLDCPDLGNAPDLPAHLDFVTARTEFYTEPTVLPTVAQGSIKLDLHRRDFTINTLAVVLTPDRWGDLLDFYGGLSDLRRKLIRVLHSLSFVDDPTRILRAVRYEQRFNFAIEPRTLELLRDAVQLIDRISPARIRHELERILQEDRPEKAIRRLDGLGVLAAIHPQFHADAQMEAQFEALRRRRAAADDPADDPLVAEACDLETGEPLPRLYWGLLIYPLLPASAPPTDDEIDESSPAHDPDDAVIQRLMLRGETQRMMRKLRALKAYLPQLEDPSLPDSQIAAILDRGTPAALLLLSIVEENPLLLARLRRYMTTWRHVHPSLDGGALRSMGIKPGPIYGKILRRLRAALIDGEIGRGEDERRLAEEIVMLNS